MTRKALALLAVAVTVVGVAGLLHSTLVEATSHSAARSFSAPWVLQGGALEVTITAAGYGGFGQVVETLPAGFSYEGSDLSDAAVAVDGQTIAFTLLGDEGFTYTVAAPSVEGVYSFSGVLLDADRAEQAIEGNSGIRVGPEPTPTPETDANADPGAHGHADAGATDCHPHSHRGAGTHPDAGTDANADPGAHGHADAGATDCHPHSHRGAGTHPDAGTDANADPGAHGHADAGATDCHPHSHRGAGTHPDAGTDANADPGAHGHADAGATDCHPHSHRGAGTHPHVGSPAPAPGARGRPATRVDRPDRRRSRLGDSCRHSVRPQTSAVDRKTMDCRLSAIIPPEPPRLGPDPKWDQRNALNVICRLVLEAGHQAH